MARKTYHLTDETYQVLIGHEAEIAESMDCDPSYIYGIKNGTHPDPFPKFQELFRACCHARAKAQIYLNKLNAIFTKSIVAVICTSQLTASLLQKIKDDAAATARIVESIADGHLDESECHEILGALAKSAENNEQLKEIVLARLGEIVEEKGAKKK